MSSWCCTRIKFTTSRFVIRRKAKFTCWELDSEGRRTFCLCEISSTTSEKCHFCSSMGKTEVPDTSARWRILQLRPNESPVRLPACLCCPDGKAGTWLAGHSLRTESNPSTRTQGFCPFALRSFETKTVKHPVIYLFFFSVCKVHQ